MKIIDALKEQGKPFLIPDSKRDDLPEFFKEMGFKVGAEIGVYVGEFTEKFCKEGLKMYAVDSWQAYRGTGRTFWQQEAQNKIYEAAKTKLRPYDNCEIIKKTSMDALADIPDGSLDFVYIDGDHKFRYIAEDLVEWSRKVRKGGIVSGHDYYRTPTTSLNVICHVKPVVDAFVEITGIDNFYLVGGKDKTRKIYDKYSSWFWLKK